MNHRRFMGRKFTTRLVAATALLSLAAVAGCSGSSGSSGSSDSLGGTIRVIDSSGHAQFKGIWDKLPEFEKKTGIKVDLTLVADTNAMRQKVLQSVQLGGQPYDVITVTDDTSGALAGKMAPLNDFIGDDAAVKSYQSQLPGWAQSADSRDGKILFAPYYAGAHAVVYRKDLFEDADNKKKFQDKFGYALPEPPKTWQQFLDVAKFFTKDGNSGLVFPAKGEVGAGLLEEFLFLNGVPYVNQDGTQLDWGSANPGNNAKVTQAAKYLQDLVYTDKVAPQQVTGMESTGAASYFTSCKAAMYMDLSYTTWGTVKDSKCGKLGSFALPTNDPKGGHIISYWMHAIPQGSKNKASAWAFLQWLHSDENITAAVESPTGTFIPAKTALLDKEVAKGVLPQGVGDAFKGGIFYRISPHTSEMRSGFNDAFSTLMSKQETPEQFTQTTGDALGKIVAGKD